MLKDQAMLDIKQCCLKNNNARKLFLVRAIKYLTEQTNAKQKDLKNGSCYKKMKVSCEVVSSVQYNCSNNVIYRKF